MPSFLCVSVPLWLSPTVSFIPVSFSRALRVLRGEQASRVFE